MSGVDTFRFWCLMDDAPVGQKPFSAVVKVNGNVEDLTREIQKEKQDLFDCDTSDVVLLKLNDPIQISPLKTLTQRIRDANFPAELDDPSTKLLKVFPEPPTEDRVQVIVVKPSGLPTPRKRPVEQMEPDLFDYEKLTGKWRSKRLKQPLPSLEELAAYISKPLESSEKVPITQRWFDGLVSPIYPDICTLDDVASLFQVSPDADPNFIPFFYAVSTPPPPPGTEYSFVYFWDLNIRSILERLLPEAKVLRNSNQHTSTNIARPGHALLLRYLCIWRGEEKQDEFADPKTELLDKLFWVYDDAPYILGYNCEGCMMTIVAITAPSSSASGEPEIKDLVRIDLSSKRDRIRNTRHLINIAYILPKLAALVRDPVKDFTVLQGENSEVEVTSSAIIKTFKCVNAEAKVQHLRGIYSLLSGHSIPNTDELIIGKGKTVYLGPRGLDGQPTTQRRLKECLICILEALVVAHKIPLFHRDIRWPNVMRNIKDESKWFLIDWEDSATPPTQAQSSLRRAIHSPDVFHDGHGAEVDIWGIGHLIKTCKAMDISSDLRQLGDKICNESCQLTAKQVLNLVTNCL